MQIFKIVLLLEIFTCINLNKLLKFQAKKYPPPPAPPHLDAFRGFVLKVKQISHLLVSSQVPTRHKVNSYAQTFATVVFKP